MATYLELKGDTFISRDAEEWRTEQMTKTLGQVAFDGFYGAEHAKNDWDDALHFCWEAAAQAVRAAVIEECAQVCDQAANEVWSNTRSEHWSDEFELLARNLRALKDKQ